MADLLKNWVVPGLGRNGNFDASICLSEGLRNGLTQEMYAKNPRMKAVTVTGNISQIRRFLVVSPGLQHAAANRPDPSVVLEITADAARWICYTESCYQGLDLVFDECKEAYYRIQSKFPLSTWRYLLGYLQSQYGELGSGRQLEAEIDDLKREHEAGYVANHLLNHCPQVSLLPLALAQTRFTPVVFQGSPCTPSSPATPLRLHLPPRASASMW
jgi:hypothetical protein